MLDLYVNNQNVTLRKSFWSDDADMIVDLTCAALFILIDYNMENHKKDCDYQILNQIIKLHEMLDQIENSIKNNKGTFSEGIRDLKNQFKDESRRRKANES